MVLFVYIIHMNRESICVILKGMPKNGAKTFWTYLSCFEDTLFHVFFFQEYTFPCWGSLYTFVHDKWGRPNGLDYECSYAICWAPRAYYYSPSTNGLYPKGANFFTSTKDCSPQPEEDNIKLRWIFLEINWDIYHPIYILLRIITKLPIFWLGNWGLFIIKPIPWWGILC